MMFTNNDKYLINGFNEIPLKIHEWHNGNNDKTIDNQNIKLDWIDSVHLLNEPFALKLIAIKHCTECRVLQ